MQQLPRSLVLKKPLTPADWLLSSVGWTVACLAGWFSLSFLADRLLGTTRIGAEIALFSIATAAHVLIWYKAVLTTWNTVAIKTEPIWLGLLSACWTLLLVLFQLACLGWLFVTLVLAFDSSGWGG